MQRFVLLALLTALSSSAIAQRWGNVPGTGLPVSHPHPMHGSTIFFADPFYSDALYREGSLSTTQPPVIILQAAPAPVVVPATPPAQPLMIELQAGRYVRISGEETSTAEVKLIDFASVNRLPSKREPVRLVASRTHSGVPAERTSAAPSSTVLLFRDGRRQEVTEYTIADGVLYTHADFYTAGAWNQKIALSSLNVPATIEANQSLGRNFRMPAAPNEVIVVQ